MNTALGRYVLGLAAVEIGVCTLIWPAFLRQTQSPFGIPHVGIAVDCIAVLEIAGGIAIQFSRSARTGAAVLAILYSIFALLWLPLWIRNPLVFDSLGNAFESFALACGALIVCGAKPARFGYYGFGLSVVTFAVYQAVHPHFTASLVPKWIPPGQMFWVVLTTIAFALAAGALLIRRSALLAAQLTTLMLIGFGLLVWVPRTWSNPHSSGNWGELGLNFGICGAAWIVAEYLAGPSVPL